MAEPITQVGPSLWMNTSEVFIYHSGIWLADGHAVVIDPGLTRDESGALVEFLRERGVTEPTVIITHGHWDHVLGAEYFPNARVIAQRKYAEMLRVNPKAVGNITERFDALKRETPFVVPQATELFDETMTLAVGPVGLELIHTPGHAPDHLVVYERASGTMWTADMLSEQEIPLVIDSLPAYERTLAQIAAMDVRVLIPCHGTVATEVSEIKKRLQEDREYLSAIHARVQGALVAQKTLAETVALCADIPFRDPDENTRTHTRNVESAYVELGGKATEPVGWARAWIEMSGG